MPRTRAHARLLGIAVAITIAVPMGSVSAADKPTPAEVQRAEELYDNGRALYAEGSYAAAATAFEEAYGLSGNLDMLYNAALAYDRADAFEPAIAALDRYRALAPASEREALDQRKKSLQLRRDKQLEAAAAEPTTSPDDGEPEPKPRLEPDVRGHRERAVSPAAWGLLGASAAGFAATAGLGGASLSFTRRAESGCVDTDAGVLCNRDVAGDASKSRPLAIASDVMLGVSSALAVAFVVVLALDLRKQKRRRANDRLWPTAGGVALRF